MKTMNYYFLGACILLGIVFFSFVTNAIGFSSGHKFLFRKIYSDDMDVYPSRKYRYEFTPLIQGQVYRPNYFYWPERNQYLIKTYLEFENVMDTETGWSDRKHPVHRYLLIDHQGKVQSSFDTDVNFSRFSGIFFAPDFYMDWLSSGSIESKRYSQIINQNLDLSQPDFIKAFRELHAQADYMEYVNLRMSGDDLHEAGVVFKIKGEWVMLLSGLKQDYMSREYNDENPKTAIWDQNYKVRFDYYDKPQDYPQSPALLQLIPLESDIEDPHIFRNYPGAGDIKVDKFEKTHAESVFDSVGIVYVSARLNGHKVKFKIPYVHKLSIWPIYNLGVRKFKLTKISVENSLEFLEVTQNSGSFGQVREGLGIYTLTERQGENFSVVSDLPEGVSEKRFNQLPINLQKALIYSDTAHTLIFDDYEINQWLPEIELLKNLRYLKIKGGLTQLPDSISQLSKLEMLDLSMNEIGKLPASFSQLKNLRHLDLSFTELKQFPLEVLELPALRKLDIGHNPFTEIPAEISRLKHLIGLDLYGAQIHSLPDSMADMRQLTITAYPEFKDQFPEKFQHLFVNKLPSYYDHLDAKKQSSADAEVAPE